MNNTNENNNFENETIETLSNEMETQETENSEATETPIYYIPYYDNGCLCWRRNDGGGENDNAALPITIGDNPVVTPIYAINCEDDMYNIAQIKGLDFDNKALNIINYGNDFYFSGKDGGDYQNHGIIHYGDIYVMNTYNHIITNLYEYKNESIKEGDGALFSFFDKDTDDINYSVVMNSVNGINRMNNICNVRGIGAKGDGESDDTDIFESALNNCGIVYVPEGTYIISRDLELKAGTELRMTNKTVIKTSGRIIMHRWTKITGGIIRVPHDFSSSVILIDTAYDVNDDTNLTEFADGSPLLRIGREIDGTTILKSMTATSDHTLAEKKDSVSGTGIEIFSHPIETETGIFSGALWNVNINANICGAFNTGIYAHKSDCTVEANTGFNNTDKAITKKGWINDLKLSGITESCKIGVHLENIENAFCDVIIQPNVATHYSDGSDIPEDEKDIDYTEIVYAEHGYLLENSRTCTFLKARVWDWDSKRTRWEPGGQYQHLALIGDCSGLVINDFLYTHSSSDIRTLIYSNPVDNLDAITILQEPVTKYFKKSDEGKPFFHNGETSKELVLKNYFDEHFQTEKLYYYEDNILPNSKPGENETLNEFGYLENTVISSATGKADDSNYITTGYISCTQGTTLYFKGLDLCKDSSHYSNKIIYYYSSSEDIKDIDNSITDYYNQNNMVSSDFVNYISYDNNISSISIPIDNDIANLKYIRICCHINDVNEPIVSTKPITCTPRGYITDGIYVKEEFVEKQTTINTDSTDDQIPSAKAVYNLLESALDEYITDVANLVGGEVE